MKKYALLLTAILALVVFASGCIDSGTNSTSTNPTSGITLDKTFSDSGITFNYPSKWNKLQTQGDIVSGGSALIALGTLGDTTSQVSIDKVDLANYPGYTVEDLKEATKTNLKSGSNAEIVSDTKSTINGLNAYEFIAKLTDPATNDELEYYYVVIGKEGKVVYYLSFLSLENDFQNQLPLFQDIEKTIKIQ